MLTKEQLDLYHKTYPNRTLPRSCGSCYACCTFLGITDLRKKAGQTCKHLTGAQGPDKRCSIYKDRPTACSSYTCCWIKGIGNDNMRPNNSGVLVTLYPPRLKTEEVSCTIHITDETKAGSLTKGPLYDTLQEIINLDINDIVVVNLRNGQVRHFLMGKIYSGKLLKQTGYEDMNFETDEIPIGSYKTTGYEARALF